MHAHPLVKVLGWFSIGLGILELVAPGSITRALGVRGHRGLVRAYGMRELVSGAGILAGRRPGPFLWSRVAGDIVDLGTLGMAALRGKRPIFAAGALAAVAAVTWFDMQAAARH
jgi:hypothetical protein